MTHADADGMNSRTMKDRPSRWPLIAALATFPLVVAPQAAFAHSYHFKTVSIGHVWAPPADKGGDTEVYGPLFNTGKATVTLKSVSTPVADKAGFRIVKDGKASFPGQIDLPPGKPVSLAAWREHIFVKSLNKPVNVGDTFDLTLDFGKTGSITVEVEVSDHAGE
jgi:hypothetical protein